MAPEIFGDAPYSTKTDVYAYAIIMWEIFAEKTPYYFLGNPNKIVKYVYIENGRPSLTDLKSFTPPEMVAIIETNWHRDPAKRMEFRDLYKELNKIFQSLP